MFRIGTLRALLRASAVLLASAGAAMAQCSMCRTALQAQGPRAAGAMNTAIVILLVPAVGLFSTVFLVAFRAGAHAAGERSGQEEEKEECGKTLS